MNRKDAESLIAETLRQLEIDTDCVVRTIEIETFEATTIDDDRPKYKRRIVIALERLPGQDWFP